MAYGSGKVTEKSRLVKNILVTLKCHKNDLKILFQHFMSKHLSDKVFIQLNFLAHVFGFWSKLINVSK